MKRLIATAAVCAALTGLLTGCSGTNYSYDGYNTGDLYRDGMAYDGYYDGRNSNIGENAGNAGRRDTRRNNRGNNQDGNDRGGNGMSGMNGRDGMGGNVGDRNVTGNEKNTNRSNSTAR